MRARAAAIVGEEGGASMCEVSRLECQPSRARDAGAPRNGGAMRDVRVRVCVIKRIEIF